MGGERPSTEYSRRFSPDLLAFKEDAAIPWFPRYIRSSSGHLPVLGAAATGPNEYNWLRWAFIRCVLAEKKMLDQNKALPITRMARQTTGCGRSIVSAKRHQETKSGESRWPRVRLITQFHGTGVS